MSTWTRPELDAYAERLADLREKATCVDAFLTMLELLREAEQKVDKQRKELNQAHVQAERRNRELDNRRAREGAKL